jgi:tryptophan-rich sensory protein
MDKRLYLVIPLIAVNSVALLFPISKTSGQNVWFRPPPYVFAVVWPLLLLLIGYSWYLRPNLSLYYAILTFLLSTWSILWAYSKLYSLLNIISTLFFTLYLIFLKYSKKSSYLLIPLFLWLCFATILNFYSI